MFLGAHQSIAGGVHKAIERGNKATCDTIQILNKSNNLWRAAKLQSDDVDAFFELIEATGVTVATSHTSYPINIASPDQALREKSYKSLKEEMERCEMLKIANLVMHPGSHVGAGSMGEVYLAQDIELDRKVRVGVPLSLRQGGQTRITRRVMFQSTSSSHLKQSEEWP